jgi:hypothetical protein
MLMLDQHEAEIAKRESIIQTQHDQIADLRKENAQKSAELKTANQNLAQAVSLTVHITLN